MLTQLLLEVGDCSFSYGEWDCFRLAKFIRDFNHLDTPFIDIAEIYRLYPGVDNLPQNYISTYLDDCIKAEKITPGYQQNFDLATVYFANRENLATYYNEKLICISSKLQIVDYHRLKVLSYYRI